MSFFRREPKKPSTTPSARTKSLLDIFAPIPVADVAESTWADWEDSMAFQNSHPDVLQAPADATTLPPEPPSPSPSPSDPFASVTKKRG